MPSTRIETRVGWLDGRQKQLIDAVQTALVEGIRIPEDDVAIRLLEYPEDSFASPPGRGPEYTVIEISMFAGRSIEAKRQLYAALASQLAPFGIAPGDLFVIVHDEPRENWSTRGVPLSDVDLGFKIEV